MNIEQLVEGAVLGRWERDRAWQWHQSQPWRLGCNFIPSDAINQLEMWQAETFNPKLIDRELGLLAGLGMNTMRVFLHDLPWQQDRAGFLARVDDYLSIAERHGIATMLVIFDSCWNPEPRLGPQRAPKPFTHNSYWLKSPATSVVVEKGAFDHLEDYVTGVVGHFRDDKRILVWDVWNEPDNGNMVGYPHPDWGISMAEVIQPLLAKTYAWARAVSPSQPLTSGVWHEAWVDGPGLKPLHRLQLTASDVVSFHNYENAEGLEKRLAELKPYDRPLLCTEYMARPAGSTFAAALPILHREKVHAYNWGSISGKTQTIYPWDSYEKTYTEEPPVWFHDIFRPDGSPYSREEVELIRSLLGKK